MSQDAISSGVAIRPSSGPSASAADDNRMSATAVAATKRLGMDMRDLAAFADGPAGDPIEVIDRSDAAIGYQTSASRLNIARLVGRAALQDRRATVPMPGNPKTGQRFRQHRFLKGGRRPTFPAIGGDIDLADLAVAGPGQPRYLVEPRSLHHQAGRGMGNHRFGFDRGAELHRLSFGHRDRVSRR